MIRDKKRAIDTKSIFVKFNCIKIDYSNMSITQLADKVRCIIDLQRSLLTSVGSVGSTVFDSSIKGSIESKMSSVFGASGSTLGGFSAEAEAFSNAFTTFLLNDDNIDMLASRAFLNGTAQFDRSLEFIDTYFRHKTPSKYPEFTYLTNSIRVMYAHPERPSLSNMLDHLLSPPQRVPAALASFSVRPTEVCNVRNPTFNLNALMALDTVDPPANANMVDSHVSLGDDAVYLVFRYNAPAAQAGNVILLCDLSNTGNIANLFATSVKVEIVRCNENGFVPRSVVPGYLVNDGVTIRPMLEVPTSVGNRTIEPNGTTIEKFRFAPGQATLNVPYGFVPGALPAQCYVIVRISGQFMTSGCGLNDIFSPETYTAAGNLSGLPDILAERTIFRTNNGCLNASPASNLNETFSSIYNRAIRAYLINPAGAAPAPFEGSMFQFPQVLRQLLRDPANDRLNMSMQRRLEFARHMYIIAILLYGLSAFSL